MMDREYASMDAGRAIGGTVQTRPLDRGASGPISAPMLAELPGLVEQVEEISRMISLFLDRVNGPRPEADGVHPSPPPCHRGQFNHLRNAVADCAGFARQLSEIG